MAKKLVFGVGVNDADYAVNPRLYGKRVTCPFYRSWVDMLMRCYSEKFQAKRHTYIGCTVCEEWLTFSNFKSWMQQQDWNGKELDKDLLVKGNKVYSPGTCVFVDKATNLFIGDNRASRGEWPIGVYLNNQAMKIGARCSNPFSGKREHLGYFKCPSQAHLAWKKRKHELALRLADLQTNEKLADALRTRYF